MKNYFLLGASKGIGFGIARELAKRNNNIFLGSRNPENLQEAAKKLQFSNTQKIVWEPVDLHDYGSVERWFNKGISSLASLDGLLINSGGPPSGTFFNFHDKDWIENFEYLLLNPIRLLRLAYPYLKQSKGSVLVITSLAAKEPIENLILSNVFRSAVTSLIKTLSREWGPEIRLNCILPGRILTERITELEKNLSLKEEKPAEQIREEYVKNIPLHRYGNVEEIGKAGAFLLSEESSYITGISLVVDGGLSRSLF